MRDRGQLPQARRAGARPQRGRGGREHLVGPDVGVDELLRERGGAEVRSLLAQLDLGEDGPGRRHPPERHRPEDDGCDEEDDPDRGLWFDPSKLLLDPYATEIDRPFAYVARMVYGDEGPKGTDIISIEDPERPDYAPNNWAEIPSNIINDIGVPTVTVPFDYFDDGTPFVLAFIGDTWTEARTDT